MKRLIHCKCGRVSRWKDMPKGGIQKTVEGLREIRHCVCRSSHSQLVDGESSSRLKTRKASKLKPSQRTVTARSIIKGRMLYMGIPLKYRNRK